jgi:ketosteroid isomerase-like protein
MIGAIMTKRAVSSAFAALNRRDLVSFMSGWSQDSVFIYPGDIPPSGVHEGKPAVESWFHSFLVQFPEIRFTAKNICIDSILACGGDNVAAAYWDVDLTNRQGDQVHNSGVTMVTAKGGQVVCVEDFFNTGEVFSKAWGAEKS